MFLKTVLWGFFLFGIVFFGDEARTKLLLSKLDAEHLQESPLSIHKTGTILKFTAEAEFEIPLLPTITTAYLGGYSNSLISYLSHNHKKVIPYWETPIGLRFELDRLTDRMIREREFTVINNLTGQRHTSFKILSETKEYYFAYAFDDGRMFYQVDKTPEPVPLEGYIAYTIEPELLFHSTTGINTCRPWHHGPKPPRLALSLDHLEPDLSAEFLRVLATPDATLY